MGAIPRSGATRLLSGSMITHDGMPQCQRLERRESRVRNFPRNGRFLPAARQVELANTFKADKHHSFRASGRCDQQTALGSDRDIP